MVAASGGTHFVGHGNNHIGPQLVHRRHVVRRRDLTPPTGCLHRHVVVTVVAGSEGIGVTDG